LVAAGLQADALLFVVSAAFVPAALSSRFFFAVFLPTTLNFRVRIAFFCMERRFEGTGIPLVKDLCGVPLIALNCGVFKASNREVSKPCSQHAEDPPSISAVLRSCGSSAGQKNVCRLPFPFVRRSHSAVPNVS
jgi:hypothetical protein